MQILDTVVLVAYLEPKDPRNAKAVEYVLDIELQRDFFIPSAVMMELDLELKAHGVPRESRTLLHSKLGRAIPNSRVLPLTAGVLKRATELSKTATWRSSSFDTMIAATGLEFGADAAITTDRKFAKLGIKPVF